MLTPPGILILCLHLHGLHDLHDPPPQSDLFKFYQSCDLASLNDVDNLPHLLSLRSLLYSPSHMRFVEKLVGLEPNTLTDEVDMAANVHTTGCHLLAHDDCIGTRAVSYILYFSDEDWEYEEDGGGLELYDSSGKGGEKGMVKPVKILNPKFGSMGLFRVVGGETVHAIQEVKREGGVRMAIQGWYHQKGLAEGTQTATLRELKDGDKFGVGIDTGDVGASHLDELVWTDFPKVKYDGAADILELGEEDRAFLGKYLNPAYLSEEAISTIRGTFQEEFSVQVSSSCWHQVRILLERTNEPYHTP